MAKRRKQSNLKANPYKAHAQDETEYGTDFIDLPGSITGGIAQLVEAKVGTYSKGKNEGEKFVYLAGIVVEPKVVVDTPTVWKDGKVQVLDTKEVEVKGQRTSQTLPLCNTITSKGKVVTADENIGTALNELRKLGGDECTAGVESEETLVQVLEALVGPDKNEGPFFKFGTSSGTPNAEYPVPRVWEKWFGAKGLEDYEPEEEDDVEENEETGGGDVEDPGETTPNADSVPDLAVLTATADEVDDNNDYTEAAEEAQRELSKLASLVGVDPESIDSWSGVAEAIAGASGSESKDNEPEGVDPNWVPKKEEVYKFKPPRARKPIQVMITAVFEKGQTVTAKSLEDQKKIYKGVAWSKLEDV